MFRRIFLARTPCFGHCPVYKLEIYPNGQVNYLGKYFVKMEGFKSWQIEAQAVKKLNDLIEKYDYFKIKEQMATIITTDSPGCITEIIMEDGRKRKIKNDYGCNQWPPKLKAFENQIDQIVNSAEYVEEE
ncbi:hypothetical protein DFR79_10813 [Halanaerobium saccharolyticum]|uniref:DUF6438 domain-containing protein n=1 Tax=Halanaerobium saccharolyticum TaxID=43595 RepID=A0A4R6LUA9_9FIRM|nr:DUF6438 domain-containing protein [Halanaerobium saccharolyticum]TDO91987.1 hypothetical protein DFR79_10813 [Halanaerobium saccharolyticum]